MDADEPARTRLADAWPLFGLRLRTEHLVLRLPTDDDLLALMDLARAGIHPSGEMPFGVAWSIGRAYQGHGHGKAMRAAMLSLAFDGLGALHAETEAFLDNTASNAVSRSLGYAKNGMGSLTPEGIPRPTQRFLMTEAMWRSRPRPPVTIDGLEACRDLFGA